MRPSIRTKGRRKEGVTSRVRTKPEISSRKTLKKPKQIKSLQNKSNSQNNKHVGTVAVVILMKVVAQQQAKFAINVANLITLPMYVEAVRRNLRVLQGDQRKTEQ